MHDTGRKAKAQVRQAGSADIGILESMARAQDAGNVANYFETCLAEQDQGRREVLVIENMQGDPVGYAMYNRAPQYALYQRLDIPEIQDVNIVPNHRGRGFAGALIRHCEDIARREARAHTGIAVAVSSNYGPAQRLYAKLGYLPDGYGVTRDRQGVGAHELHPVNELCMMLVKDL